MGAWARGWVSRRTFHPTSRIYSLFLWQMEVKRGNLRLLSPQIKPESKCSLRWGSSARGVPAEPPGRGSLASSALSEEAHGAEISLLAAWRVSGTGDITVKAENFDISVFGGQKDNLKASATCNFSLPVSPLLRYEDEIRLCSGMEYTFTELKKVSGKRRFSSGRALHRLREVTGEAGAAGCSGGAQPRAGSGLRPRAAAVLGGNRSRGGQQRRGHSHRCQTNGQVCLGRLRFREAHGSCWKRLGTRSAHACTQPRVVSPRPQGSAPQHPPGREAAPFLSEKPTGWERLEIDNCVCSGFLWAATPWLNIPPPKEQGGPCAQAKKIPGAGRQGMIRQRKRSPQMIVRANCMFSLTH